MSEQNNKQRSFGQYLAGFGRRVIGLFTFGKKKGEEDVLKEGDIISPAKAIRQNFFRNRIGIIGLIGFVSLLAFVFIGSMVTKFDPYYEQGVLKNIGPGHGYLKVPAELSKEGVAQIDSGTTFSVGLSKTGKVYLWGKDANDETYTEIPEDIAKAIKKDPVVQVAAGDRHVLILTENGELYSWGNNSFNQTVLPPDKKVKIRTEKPAKIGGGDQFSVVLTKTGSLYIWGSTLSNKLDKVPTVLKNNVKDFAISSTNVLALTKDGKVLLLGSKGGPIDTGLPSALQAPKTKEADPNNDPTKIESLAMTTDTALALDSEGQLHIWGSNNKNGLNMPEELKSGQVKIKSIVAGRNHYVAVAENGKLYAWGSNFYGESDVPDGEYTEVFSGFFQNYALTAEGSVKSWGLNGFVMGTDELGRDMLTRLIHGGKITMQISAVALILQIVIGVMVGMIAGYYGGRVDNLLMRLSEIVSSFPFYPLVITLSAALPTDTSQNIRLFIIMMILGILGWTGIARLVRGQILTERERDYVLAANALGIKKRKIMLNHIFPNIISIVIVQATLGYASNLLTEAGLSFLGFGVKVPYPSWGNMMNNAQSTEVMQVFWWRWILPALAVFIAALTINLIGDALRDAMDPKANER
ncbi:MAG: ABC transporter permease subunit [Lachnospiraceae bacterium]|nr:ABC transporter permease subunit [Lachnospiraceae bacterium]MDY5742876.1 ABC transporter permease subunit [Lachnospiraceae bacterium]